MDEKEVKRKELMVAGIYPEGHKETTGVFSLNRGVKASCSHVP